MKLAFIGTGKIIADALFAIEPIKEIEKTAIFARPHSKEKAEAFAKQYNIAEVYTDYEKLLTETAADTVYIGLINSAHYSYAKEALLHRKNVILEKPFTGFYKEAQELQQIAEENKLFIFEAVTVLHNEVFYEMKKNVEKLGTVRMALCNYSQYSSRYDAYLEGDITHSFDPAYYGGALYDLMFTIFIIVLDCSVNRKMSLTIQTSVQMVSILLELWFLYMMVSVLYVPEAKILTAQDMFPFKVNKAL